jgi:hypothetical protein
VTATTKRRLLFCAVVLALTVPAEWVLVKAVTTDARTAAAQWADGLSASALEVAASEVQNYPFQYRKEVMRRLSPKRRAEVWVDHIAAYRDARPELSTDQVDALNAAIASAKATFSAPSQDTRVVAKIVAERITDLFGADVADYLMHRLGDRTTLMLTSATPWHLKLADYVRDRFVVQAEADDPCYCSMDFGCDLMSGTTCDDSTTCRVDSSWPACGWWWDDDCDGMCAIMETE